MSTDVGSIASVCTNRGDGLGPADEELMQTADITALVQLPKRVCRCDTVSDSCCLSLRWLRSREHARCCPSPRRATLATDPERSWLQAGLGTGSLLLRQQQTKAKHSYGMPQSPRLIVWVGCQASNLLALVCFLGSIIFIRDRNSHCQEVSAYIDYAHRLTTDDFEVYFSGKKRLFPRNTDLSFYNWDRNVSTSNSSPNYEVIAENACGLLFKNRSDRKIINVDPKAYPGDNTTRTPVKTDLYLHVVIYDHIIRRGT
nr:PREDICTED: uncharacterized protein C4orf22 homolog [Phalacrocorax carbo]